MNAAVIVAAGRGSRMGLDRNKVLYPLCGEPIVVRTARAFADSGLFDGGVVVVTGADDIAEMTQMFAQAGVCVRAVVPGGADRQGSVYCGIQACAPDADIIAIHDGARPLVTCEVIERTIDSAKRYGSGVAAVMLGVWATSRAPSVQVTLLIFVAQLFMSMMLDAFFLNKFSMGRLIGGGIVLIGAVLNVIGDQKNQAGGRK